MTSPNGLPKTLGSLRCAQKYQTMRSVKTELRDNLIAKLKSHERLFPGIVGYDDTVAPQVVNAVLSQHNFILLGLRGQAKTKLIRMLVSLLDENIPYIAGCEIHDHPFAPICKPCRDLAAEMGDATPIPWLPRQARYVEKLASPLDTIAPQVRDTAPPNAASTPRPL